MQSKYDSLKSNEINRSIDKLTKKDKAQESVCVRMRKEKYI